MLATLVHQGTLRIAGNNYIKDGELGEFWIEGFKKFQPGVTIDYFLPTAAIAIPALACGRADIGMSNKALLTDLRDRGLDLDQAMRDAAASRVEGLVVQPSLPQRPIAERLLRARLPGVSGERSFIEAGGLLSVNSSAMERYRAIALYIDRILKGAVPRDLPILQGTTLVLAGFFMLLNLTVDVIQTMVDPRIRRG